MLVFSFLSIGIYLILVSRHDVDFPSAYMLTLIFLLTFAHAVLMVSSAIVISVQATTIRSANLMASFVVVPVAFLLQGETILIFWGNEDVLWFAILGVTLLSGLLVRLGLAHFKREYRLGREIDTLNIKNTFRVFRDRFVGGAKSFVDWYRLEIPATLGQLKQPLPIVVVLGVITLFVSYAWVVINVPAYIEFSPDRLEDLREMVGDNLVNLDELKSQLPAPLLFFYNARTTVVFLLMGLISFGTLGLTLYMINFALVGGVLGAANLVGFSPLLTFVVGVLPHGLFELTAVILAGYSLEVCRITAGDILVCDQSSRYSSCLFTRIWNISPGEIAWKHQHLGLCPLFQLRFPSMDSF